MENKKRPFKLLTSLSWEEAKEERPLLSSLEAFRAVTENIVKNSLYTLIEMEEDLKNSPALREKYHLLYHYLDYLYRFCQGQV